MKAMLSSPIFFSISISISIAFLLIALPAVSFASEQNDISLSDSVQDYCYKPSKPLFFATTKYKRIYAEDMSEYKHCRQSYIEMKERVASMKAESDKNARLIHDNFMNTHY